MRWKFKKKVNYIEKGLGAKLRKNPFVFVNHQVLYLPKVKLD